MDADELELQEIQSAFTRGLAASDEEYRTQMNALSTFHDEQLQGASEEQRRISWKQYYQKKEALLARVPRTRSRDYCDPRSAYESIRGPSSQYAE